MTIVFLFLNVLLMLGVAWWVGKRVEEKMIYWSALGIKVICGFLLGWLYFFYYEGGGDTVWFFNDGKIFASYFRESPIEGLKIFWSENPPDSVIFQEYRSLFFSKLVGWFCLITHDNYWLISAWFSLMSFLASVILVNVIIKFFPAHKFAAIFSFLFLPSVVFWTSGVIKESIAGACLFFLSAVFLKLWIEKKVHSFELVLSIISIWIFWTLKYYFAGIFLSFCVALFLSRIITQRFKIQEQSSIILIWVLVCGVPMLAITFLHPNFNLDRILFVVVENNQAFMQLSAPGDAIIFNDLQPTIKSIMLNSPLAVFSGLFRPFFWEAQTSLQIFAAIENLFILALTVMAVLKIKMLFKSQDFLLMLGVISYVLTLCVFLTLSTPNFGTLSRYRVAYIPFFVFLVLCEGTAIKIIQSKISFLFNRR